MTDNTFAVRQLGVPKPSSAPAVAKITGNAYTEDKDTGELRRPHHVDLKTGMYKGRQVITPKKD